MLEIPVMFSQLTNLTSALMEWIPQREKERGSRERQKERGRESSREDWSPLRNNRIPVKLLQAEGSDHKDVCWETQKQPAKPSGVGRVREEPQPWLWQLCDNFFCCTCCGCVELGAQQVGEHSTLFRPERRESMIWTLIDPFFRFEPKLFSNERARVPFFRTNICFLPLLA